jgi:hypothetical protein
MGLFNSSVLSQGKYGTLESTVLNIKESNKIAKSLKIKSISRYNNYKDSLNKGECLTKNIYNDKGLVIKTISSPESKKQYIGRRLSYDSYNNLIEIKNYSISDSIQPIGTIQIIYDNLNRFTAISRLTNRTGYCDTTLYFYSNDNKLSYKLLKNNTTHKIKIKYNDCGKIEYVENLPIDINTIQLNDNNCLTYYQTDLGDNKETYEKESYLISYNSNCQPMTTYSEVFFRRHYQVGNDTILYNNESKKIKHIFYGSSATSKKKCLKRISFLGFSEYEYNNFGLLLYRRDYSASNTIESIYFKEYEYHKD